MSASAQTNSESDEWKNITATAHRNQDRVHRVLKSNAESLAKHLETFRNGNVRILLAFKFERHITAIADLAQNVRDAHVIKVQCVPLATAVIRFCLNENGFRRNLFKLWVWV